MLSPHISATILRCTGAFTSVAYSARIETRALPSTSRPNLFSGD